MKSKDFIQNKEEKPAYYQKLKKEAARKLFEKILRKLTKEKLYRNPSYSVSQLARDLHTNTRYIAIAIALVANKSYTTLVNSLRINDACKMLQTPSYDHLSIEEIGLLLGFGSRQSFYVAFHRFYNCTPQEYRKNQKEKFNLIDNKSFP